jgi:hypothetical protein
MRRKHRIPQLSDEAYQAQLEKQEGGCWICGRFPKNRRLAGDHNHRTGARRALLCYVCNRLIVGRIERFGIPPDRIAAYFKEFPD